MSLRGHLSLSFPPCLEKVKSRRGRISKEPKTVTEKCRTARSEGKCGEEEYKKHNLLFNAACSPPKIRHACR